MCNMSPKAVKILVTLIVLGVIGGIISVVVYFLTAQSTATVNVQGEHAQSKLSKKKKSRCVI